MKSDLQSPTFRARFQLQATAWVVLGCLLCILTGCQATPRSGKDSSKAVPEPAPTGNELPESADMQAAKFEKGRLSAQYGDSLKVWYKNAGDSVIIVTAAQGSVLLHIDCCGETSGNGGAVYGALDKGAICSYSERTIGQPLDCDEHRSAAWLAQRSSGSILENWWKFPKRELSASGGNARLKFEVFDAGTQFSRFFPEGANNVALLSLSGETAAQGTNSRPTLFPEPQVVTRPNQGGNKPRADEDLFPPPKPAPTVYANRKQESTPEPQDPWDRCAESCYRMQLSSLGRLVEQGQRYKQNDPMFAAGSNLILSIEYKGVEPNRTELSIEWYVGKKPVSYFPAFRAPARSGQLHRAYDNERVEPGEHTVIMKVNGQELDQPRLSFFIDPEQPPAEAPNGPAPR